MATPNELFTELVPKLAATIRSASGLAAQDINFYKSLDTQITAAANETTTEMLRIVDKLLRSVDDSAELEYNHEESVEAANWTKISNVLDNLFERADIAMDSFVRGGNGGANDSNLTYLEDGSGEIGDDKPAKRLEKPQLSFKTAINNDELTPFKPLLEDKPHALKPLDLELVESEDPAVPSHYEQPYGYEINNQPYPEWILTDCEPQSPQDWNATSAIWVDTKEELHKMLETLRTAKTIAVDLEHHDYRTYYGLVCLMQISDRNNDWIVDTLALRDELVVLNEVFADPQIVKVFHGAFMDIIWLQRDLGLYVVSLFDTYHASRQMGLSKHSLAYLLEHYAKFKTSKKYQLADWRIRPLSAPMLAYARSDTHFLLYIFDLLTNELRKQDKLSIVLHESRGVAVRRFEYTQYKPDVTTPLVVSPLNDKLEPWKSLMNQYNVPYAKEKILIALFQWRDRIARRDDESVRYVMPNQLLITLVSNTPTDAHGVLACSNYISDHVRINSSEIAEIIKNALQQIDQEDLAIMDSMPNSDVEIDVQDVNVIGSMTVKFNKLMKRVQNLTTGSLLKQESILLVNGDVEDDYRSVEYTRGEKVVHETSEFLDRRDRVLDVLDTIKQQEILAEEEEEQSTEEAGVIVAVEVPEPPKKREDPDEIITLRKKNNNNSNKPNKKEETPEVPAFDYLNAEKILLEKPRFDRNDKKNKTKKRSFDPYSQESEGPKAAKKVHRVNAGKTSSFVQRKKR